MTAAPTTTTTVRPIVYSDPLQLEGILNTTGRAVLGRYANASEHRAYVDRIHSLEWEAQQPGTTVRVAVDHYAQATSLLIELAPAEAGAHRVADQANTLNCLLAGPVGADCD